MTSTQEVVDRVIAGLRSTSELKKATNINNKTTTNNTNNKTTKFIVDESDNAEDLSLRSPLGLASLSSSPKGERNLASPRDSIHFSGGSELPANWRNFKWDLYRNPSTRPHPQLRLNLNIVRLDGSQCKLTASLNSPQDRVFRRVCDEELEESHWQLIRQEYRLWRSLFGTDLAKWRASKFYQPGKKSSTDLVVFFREQDQDYQVRLFYCSNLLDYSIPKSSQDNLTVKQIQNNQIATLLVGRSQQKLLRAQDLGI